MAVTRFKNANIHYTVSGSGETVVLLHGFLEHIYMWQDIILALSQTSKVIAIDLLGHGKTDSIGYIHTIEDQAHLVRHVLKEQQCTRGSLVGHSMGGYVALAFAEIYPELTHRIVLLNSTAYPDSEEKKINRDRAINAVKYNAQTFIKMAIVNLFTPINQVAYKAQVHKVTQEALKTPVQGIIAALEGMKIRKDRTHLYQNKAFSFLMILGKEDPAIPYQSLLSQTKGTDVLVKKLDGGHMSHIIFKKKVISLLKEFFGSTLV